MISLKEYITESLTQISEGVLEANEALKSKNVEFAPYKEHEQGQRLDVFKVDFDVLLSVSEANSNSKTGEGKIDLKVLSFNIGGGLSQGSNQENIQSQRIQFGIWGKFRIDETAQDKQKRDEQWKSMPRAGTF
jgi:hypothetical protein